MFKWNLFSTFVQTLTETDKTSTMTQERFFELVYAWKDGDLTGDELYQRVFVLSNVVGRSEQLSLSDFRIGFEYEELQMDSERYLNKGMIWVKKTYGLNSPRLHKIQKLLDEGKLRKA